MKRTLHSAIKRTSNFHTLNPLVLDRSPEGIEKAVRYEAWLDQGKVPETIPEMIRILRSF